MVIDRRQIVDYWYCRLCQVAQCKSKKKLTCSGSAVAALVCTHALVMLVFFGE